MLTVFLLHWLKQLCLICRWLTLTEIEVWYLVKYIQYKHKNKPKTTLTKAKRAIWASHFFQLLIKVFNISLPQKRGHILWQVVVTMGQTAWSTTAMEITLGSTVKSSHLSPTYRTAERTHSYQKLRLFTYISRIHRKRQEEQPSFKD